MKRMGLVLCAISALLISSALSQGSKVIVITDTANIYAEPDSHSYLIETVGKGTVLTLFQKSKIRKTWYYIAFDSKERKGKVSGFVQDSAVQGAHDVQNSLGSQQNAKGDWGQRSILPPLKEESVVLAEEKKVLPDKSWEELSLTPLFKQESISLTVALRGEIWPIVASPTWEVVAFHEVSEPPVEIKPREMNNINASPMKDGRAFQSIIKPPVEIRGEIPLPLPAPIKEALAFKGNKDKSQVTVSEKISITPLQKDAKRDGDSILLTCSPTREVVAFQERTEPKVKIESRKIQPVNSPAALESKAFQRIIDRPANIEAKEMPPLSFSSSKDVAFQEVVQPPVEIKARTLPPLNPPAAMEDNVFQRMKRMRKIDTFKTDSFIGVSPSKKVVTLERTRMEELRERKPEEEAKRQPTPLGTRKVKTKFKWVTLGLGYGQSLGGAGGFVQFNTKAGLSVHGGVGYYPTRYIYSGCDGVKDVTLYTGGVKYYLPLGADPLHFYLNLQFGGIGVEVAQIIKGIWQYDFIFDYKQKTLWGPAFLSGFELRLGSLGLNGAMGLSYNITKLDWDIQDYFLTFDLGLLLYF